MSSLRMEGYLPGRRQTTRGHRPGVILYQPEQGQGRTELESSSILRGR